MINTSAQLAPIGSQQFIDRVALEYHKIVAERLLADPEAMLSDARSNIQRWMKAHEGSGSQLALEEWLHLLSTKTIQELIAIITEDSDEGQRLRSSTPFAGILSAEESRELWRHCEERSLF